MGPWLPEPLASEATEDAGDPTELDESLSIAFLVLLESLNPVERAVFLLHEVFDYAYGEISRIVGKSEGDCRQIARRARQSVAGEGRGRQLFSYAGCERSHAGPSARFCSILFSTFLTYCSGLALRSRPPLDM